MLKNSLVTAGLLAYALAGQSALNVLNEETGDFGGLPFPLREKLSTFIETDASGEVTSYGFYMPKLSDLGMDSTTSVLAPSHGAALDFDKSGLADPSQVPFEFVGINYNPGGHPGVEYLIPHFDLHFWLHPNEYARGIECNGTDFPPCATTAWLEKRFQATPSYEYYPVGSVNSVFEWVPTMGAHLIPLDPPDDFVSNPAIIIGSYLGKVIYYEPMVSSQIFLDSEIAPQEFAWPVLKYPTPGKYYKKIRIEYQSADRLYKFSLTDLVQAPEEHRGRKIFMGEQYSNPSGASYSGSVSSSKDCLINSGNIVDGGYAVSSSGVEYCCRARGIYNSPNCETNQCGSLQTLVPNSFLFNAVTEKCYARCVLRV